MAYRARNTARGHAARQLGSYLRKLRKQSGWTQGQTAGAIDVDTVTVRRWELGIYAPSQKNLERLANVYELDVDDMVQGALSPVHADESVPVKGHLGVIDLVNDLPATARELMVPGFILEDHASAFYLAVVDNCLTRDGVHSGDLVLVDPNLPVQVGRLWVVRIGEELRGGVHVSSEELALRTPSGSSELLQTSWFELVGGVVWHMRKI